MDKDFCRCLYTTPTPEKALESYCPILINSPLRLTCFKGQSLLKYKDCRTNKESLKQITRIVTYALQSELVRAFPTLKFDCPFGRVKSLISVYSKTDEIEDTLIDKFKIEFIKEKFGNKISKEEIELQKKSISHNQFIRFLNSYSFEKNPFDRIKDFFAFRLILEDDGKSDCSSELYDIANFVMEFFKRNSFYLIPSDPLVKTGKLSIDPNLIFVPKKSKLKKDLIPYAKDYVLYPKTDGYQSIQFAIRDPYSEQTFEFQIRSRSMDIVAETLANHDIYKLTRYAKQFENVNLNVDYSKIDMDGFRYFTYKDKLTNEKKVYIHDSIGIVHPIPIRMEDIFSNF